MEMLEPLSSDRYNAALLDPTIGTAVRHFARGDAGFRSEAFVERVATLPTFPILSVGELLDASQFAGVQIYGAHACVDEARSTANPFLTYLKRSPSDDGLFDLVRVETLGRRTAVLSNGGSESWTITIKELTSRWSGILLLFRRQQSGATLNSEIDAFRNEVTVLSDFLGSAECAELIDYCEAACFRRSRVIQQRRGTNSDVISPRTRNSTSVVLKDRHQPILARLYRQCAALEGVDECNVEQIQCVRYKRGQKFRSHYDSGIALPRMTTFLLYLNEAFTGGETFFPMLDLAVRPKTGSCLRFPSCSKEGRVLWQSEHGGLPVEVGVKYALNIWVRCPSA